MAFPPLRPAVAALLAAGLIAGCAAAGTATAAGGRARRRHGHRGWGPRSRRHASDAWGPYPQRHGPGGRGAVAGRSRLCVLAVRVDPDGAAHHRRQ